MFNLENLIDLWNQEMKGYCRTVRLKQAVFDDKKISKAFNDASKYIKHKKDWEIILKEIKHTFDSDDNGFWDSRRGKQAFSWLFQRRNKGQGEMCWMSFYEMGMDREDKEETYNNVFAFEKNDEELP